MTQLPRNLLLCALLLPGFAFAAQPAGAVKDKEAVSFREIERGPFFGVSGGVLYLLNPPSASGPRPGSFGQMGQIEAGVTLFDRLSISALLMASASRVGSEYIGNSGGQAWGDFSMIAPGGAARFNFLGFNDNQGVARTWLYARAGGAMAFFSPVTLLPDPELLVFGGIGVEYFTRLRHFSVGMEANGTLLPGSGTVGFNLTPTVRYAF